MWDDPDNQRRLRIIMRTLLANDLRYVEHEQSWNTGEREYTATYIREVGAPYATHLGRHNLQLHGNPDIRLHSAMHDLCNEITERVQPIACYDDSYHATIKLKIDNTGACEYRTLHHVLAEAEPLVITGGLV